MRLFSGLLALMFFVALGSAGRAEDMTARRFTAPSYPMDYYVSLPAGWTQERTWPVLVAIPDASREFTQVMDTFMAARRSKPWIIVVPVVLGAGGPPQRYKEIFDYKQDVWDRAEKDSLCGFDPAGLAAVLQDVHARFKSEGRAFITGYEAAGHVLWREVVHNPKAYYAAAMILPNFQGRCIDEPKVVRATTPLPIAILRGADDKLAFNGAPLDLQAKAAADYARGIGHRVEEITVPGKTRGPFPDQVFEFFENTRAGR